MSILFGIIGFLVAPFSIRSFIALMRWMDSRLTRVPTNDLMGGAIGGSLDLLLQVYLEIHLSVSNSSDRFWQSC